MKNLFRLVVVLLMMSFAGNNLFAQNDEKNVVNQMQSSYTDDPNVEAVDTSVSDTPPGEPNNQSDASETDNSELVTLNMNDLASVVALLNNTDNDKKKNILTGNNNLFIPLSKKDNVRGHHVCQRLELSVLTGKDKTAEKEAISIIRPDGGSNEKEDSGLSDLYNQASGKNNAFNIGANFGYSIVFVPASKDGDQLSLNRFGFGYSVGTIFQFDRETKAGVTCDLLGKIGVETGFNKAIGVGADFLFGGGKTAEATLDFSGVDFESEEDDSDNIRLESEGLWCAKVGTQLWLRLNFLTRSVKNFDTALFTRFVYSFRPYGDEERLNSAVVYDEIRVWQEESWQFGFTMTYFF